MSKTTIPVVTIDGPSGSGKGTVGRMLARELGYQYLDSGALYRLLALAACRHKVSVDNVEGLAVLAAHMDISFDAGCSGEPKILLEGEEVTAVVRTEEMGAAASVVVAIPAVRKALLRRQRAFVQAPGLVADGRDMGTVVFPAAGVKIYLTAAPEVRAQRRYNQLIDKGENVSLAALVEQVRERDERDEGRQVSPLRPAAGALILDSSTLTIEQVFAAALKQVRRWRKT